MHAKILNNLKLLEEKENMKILYACESGSRAWGFPSADSDYDVRFIYVRQKEWYLRVDHELCRDVVEQPISDLLDINGWDLKKALKLMRKSNPALIEWLNSPVVYRKNVKFTECIKSLIADHYSPRSCFYHYSQMAIRNFKKDLRSENVKIKKYFYVLRPILAMQWIEQDRGVVPMEFEPLVNELIHNQKLKEAIDNLIKEKRQGLESDYSPKIGIISDFIEKELLRFKDKALEQPENVTDFSLLNPFFLKTVNGEYNDPAVSG